MNPNPIQQGLEALLLQAAGQVIQQVTTELASNPQDFLKSLDDLISPCHTGYDACQDILDACEHGHISHEAAMQTIAVLMNDMKQRKAVDVRVRRL